MAQSNSKVEQAAKACGLYVGHYGPGDGITRYRFFREDTDYFSDNGIYTALGAKEALIFLEGYAKGRAHGLAIATVASSIKDFA